METPYLPLKKRYVLLKKKNTNFRFCLIFSTEECLKVVNFSLINKNLFECKRHKQA